MIVARLRRGRRLKAEMGGRAVGAAPFGYAAEGGALVPDARERRVIDRMSQMRESGRSLREIADVLNREGVGSKRRVRWYPMTVGRVLEREAVES